VYQQQLLMQQALLSTQVMSEEHKYDDYSDIHNFGKFTLSKGMMILPGA
jgi:hypothetical protein